MPLEANLFYGGVSSPSRTKRPAADLTASLGSSSSSSASTSRSSMHTPSPSRTSRIPPPPTSPSPSSSRRAASRRRPASASSSSASKVSPNKFKLHFQGRVYRPFSATSPPNARKLYSPSQGLLGQPDELVEHAGAIIDCPCERNEDDSTLMIQCEECDIWLHARCVGFEYEEQCPDDYYCRKCAPSSSSGKAVLELKESHRGTAGAMHTKENSDNPNRIPSPPSSIAGVSESEEDGGLEVETHEPLVASPLNRTPTRTPKKRAPISPSQYSVSRNLLSELANASPIIKASPSHPLLTPSKRAKLDSSIQRDSAKDDCDNIETPENRFQISRQSPLQTLDASTVPLPDHYASLLNLHAAVERALLLHLATEGAKACSAAVVSSDSANGADNIHVDLPNLATFTGIRSVVERGSGRRFGPTELAQLIWLWEGGLNGPQATEDVITSSDSFSSPGGYKKDKKRGGLSMSVSAARELDRNNGKRVYTWGIGIHLELKQNVQLPALELVGSSPTQSSHGAETPPALNLKRVGLSVLPLWSSKAEYRREEMRRRLGECVLKAHEDFSFGQSTLQSQSSSASKKKQLSDPFERELQLPPTPPPSNCKKTSGPASSVFSKGFILDALPPIPAASLPPLGASSLSSLSNRSPPKNQGIANAETADIAREERASLLPNTRDTTSRPAKQLTDERRSMLLDGHKEQVKKAPAEQRAMSLLDRIKAKEAAQQAAKDAQASNSASDSLLKGSSAMKAKQQTAARMSLEAASARAKKKASQRLL